MLLAWMVVVATDQLVAPHEQKLCRGAQSAGEEIAARVRG